jgi:hypothetical protein
VETVPDVESPPEDGTGDGVATDAGVDVLLDVEVVVCDVEELDPDFADEAAAVALPAFVCSASNPSAATAAVPPTARDVMRRRLRRRARSRSAGVTRRWGVSMRTAWLPVMSRA